MIVLDTNIVSELMRPSPDAAVLAWIGRHARANLNTTAVTVAEIRFGLARLPPGRRSRRLRQTADEVFAAFPAQVLSFDMVAADRYGDIAAAREKAGQPIAAFDAQIAAICQSRDAPLATRNTADFMGTGIELIDPWTA